MVEEERRSALRRRAASSIGRLLKPQSKNKMQKNKSKKAWIIEWTKKNNAAMWRL